MNNKTTLVVAAVVFALVGTLVFAAVAPYLSTGAHATVLRKCPDNSPDQDGPQNGCGPLKKIQPCHGPKCD